MPAARRAASPPLQAAKRPGRRTAVRRLLQRVGQRSDGRTGASARMPERHNLKKFRCAGDVKVDVIPDATNMDVAYAFQLHVCGTRTDSRLHCYDRQETLNFFTDRIWSCATTQSPPFFC